MDCRDPPGGYRNADLLTAAAYSLPVEPHRIDFLTFTADGRCPPGRYDREGIRRLERRAKQLGVIPMRVEVQYDWQDHHLWRCNTDLHGHAMLPDDTFLLSDAYEVSFVVHGAWYEQKRVLVMSEFDELLTSGHRIATGEIWLSTTKFGSGAVRLPGTRLLFGGAARARWDLVESGRGGDFVDRFVTPDVDLLYPGSLGHGLESRFRDVEQWVDDLRKHYVGDVNA